MAITQEELRSLVHYDRETGVFIRLVKTSKNKALSVMGSLHPEGSITIYLKGVKYKAHRLAFLYETGELPKEAESIDHINHNQSDNRFSNLRKVSNLENSRNLPLFKNNKSGVPGVRWVKRRNSWLSRITLEGTKDKFLGYFEDFFDAVCARKSAENIYGYHKNNGRGRSLSKRVARVNQN